jgi:S1-C subfamily serine protease
MGHRMEHLVSDARAHGRRLRRRILTLVVAGLVAIGVVAGVAVARSGATPTGTGVVVVRSTLAYQRGTAAGTGMVLTSSGEVLTNNHVIRGATSIKIVVPGTKRSYTARVVGYDVADDVAVLQATGASNLKTVSTAGSAKLSIRQAVTAVGNAGGTGKLSSSKGTITGLSRSIVVSDGQGGTERLSGLIETNAALQPGDSGGPLLNSARTVIGMNTAASTTGGFRFVASSDGYAIPIAKALSIAKRIESGKSSTRVHVGATAFLGIAVQPSGGPAGFSNGALIAGVVAGGPAASAGLTAGDVITAIDGHAVTSSTSISSYLLTKKPGAKVKVAYRDRFGTRHSTSVTLASGPAQ